jgi:hypothetical protein
MFDDLGVLVFIANKIWRLRSALGRGKRKTELTFFIASDPEKFELLVLE